MQECKNQHIVHTLSRFDVAIRHFKTWASFCQKRGHVRGQFIMTQQSKVLAEKMEACDSNGFGPEVEAEEHGKGDRD